MTKILIRTDGGLQIGNGHVIRMQALAEELIARQIPVCFGVHHDEFWITRLKDRGFDTHQLSNTDRLIDVLKRESITHLVYDTRNDLTAQQLMEVKRETGVKIIVIDSPEETRLAADAVIYPPIPQVQEWNWNSFEGQIFTGWEYAMLRKEFVNRPPTRARNPRRVLLSFGSTDPYHLTEWCLRQIEQCKYLFKEIEFVVVIGPQFDRLQGLEELESTSDLNITVLQGPTDIVGVYQSVDYALIALGVTAYELAALSIPFLFVSISNDHAKSGEVFEREGIGYSLGIMNQNLDNFEGKVAKFVSTRSQTDLNITRFSNQHKVCNWTKIIQATVEQNTYA